jgi:hypothetical protein
MQRQSDVGWRKRLPHPAHVSTGILVILPAADRYDPIWKVPAICKLDASEELPTYTV